LTEISSIPPSVLLLEFEWPPQSGGDSAFGAKLDLTLSSQARARRCRSSTHESADCGTFAATGTSATHQSCAAFALPFADLRIAGVQGVVAAFGGDRRKVRQSTSVGGRKHGEGHR
jgi:hypothetical protein